MHTPSVIRVASRYCVAQGQMRKEAAFRDWMKWICQPIKVILQHHREFVYGPVEEAVQAIIKKLAPKLFKAIAEHEIDEDVDEFLEGANHGKWDADKGVLPHPPRQETADYLEGYEWGFENAATWQGKTLPRDVQKHVVEEAVHEFKKHVSVQLIANMLEKAWSVINPKHTCQAIVRACKKHGWKLGVGFALFEVLEHFAIPAVIAKLTGDPKWLALASLPIGEVIYAVMVPILGRTPKEVDKYEEDGHLDWYEKTYGPVRLASEIDFPPLYEWLTAYREYAHGNR